MLTFELSAALPTELCCELASTSLLARGDIDEGCSAYDRCLSVTIFVSAAELSVLVSQVSSSDDSIVGLYPSGESHAVSAWNSGSISKS